MALPFLSKKARVVTITIEEDAIRYVELKSIDPLHISLAEEMVLPAGVIRDGEIVDVKALGSILGEAVNQWGLSKKSVRFLAPDEFVIIRKVAFPQGVKTDELQGHFFIEIGSTLYLPFEDPVFDVVPYNDNKEVLIIASKESVVNSYEQVLGQAKLKAAVADITPLALYRLAYLQHDFIEDEHIMMIDLQSKKMTVSIFHEHYPLFMRPVELNLTDEEFINPDIFIEEIETEIEKLGNFYRYSMNAGEAGITKIICNGLGDWPELQSRLESRLSVPVYPIVMKPIPTELNDSVPERFNRAIGLALKEV
ncbi:pilus assembly protein PilM [Microbacterium sp. APC 3898]|uniref:Pilus assembly protein PilM n=1 Tax=Planococcus notacanthi TaxID=3035188 RepID=A0ABT7ZIG0_9BACL|nr:MULTISPECIES: pilus assembly protein PilM [Terrabacteria group]MDN3426937.1 pilus assembly protein PilM [Planococcus sp. APC 4016]MDN3499915.1 pilus assembly protein PilM [Microbacterium sp. APC 3898]